jgi:uncharacterized protein YodC (DUF2158 family)
VPGESIVAEQLRGSMGKNSTLFNIGDIVRLKSGGPPMTVVQLPAVDLPSLPPLPGDDQFVCNWFESKRHHQKSFPAEALEAAPDSDATGINVSALLDAVEAIKAKRDGGAS